MNSLGIDFGTSNCLAHVATPNDVFPVELESGSFSLPSVVFTARREVAMRQIWRFARFKYFAESCPFTIKPF